MQCFCNSAFFLFPSLYSMEGFINPKAQTSSKKSLFPMNNIITKSLYALDDKGATQSDKSHKVLING